MKNQNFNDDNEPTVKKSIQNAKGYSNFVKANYDTKSDDTSYYANIGYLKSKKGGASGGKSIGGGDGIASATPSEA